MALRTQKWEPDTHPGVELHTQWDDQNPAADHVCFLALVDGVEQADPEGLYLTILEENRLKNRALAIIEDLLPKDWKRPELDADGDPTGEMVVKARYRPSWDFGMVDGKVSFTVPGADAKLLKTLRAALEQFGEAVSVG